ncbi:MAG: hypothetical protein AAFY22_13630 [Pseudomonadota bacterium]
MRILIYFLLSVAAPLLSGCGFQPLYATPEGQEVGGFQEVALAGVQGPESIAPLISDAFTERRLVGAGAGNAEYDLTLEAEEFAQRLAVQIDASVTRFNYILRGDYALTRRSDGKVFRGGAEATASFNVVDSQYSTLFAEQAAREKAARALIESIERDILLTLSAEADEARDAPEPGDRSIELRDEFSR